MRSTWPLAVTEAMRIVQANLATVMLGALSTTYDVGAFRIASSMSALLSLPVTLVNVVLAPIITRLHIAGESIRLEKLMGWASLGMSLSITILCLPFAFFGEEILSMMFGQGFGTANSSLLVLGMGAALGCLFGPGVSLLNMTGYEKRVTRSVAIGVGLLAVLLLIFGCCFGAFGASVAVSVSFILWSAIMWCS